MLHARGQPPATGECIEHVLWRLGAGLWLRDVTLRVLAVVLPWLLELHRALVAVGTWIGWRQRRKSFGLDHIEDALEIRVLQREFATYDTSGLVAVVSVSLCCRAVRFKHAVEPECERFDIRGAP